MINVLIVVAKILFFSELGSFFVTISLVEGLIGEAVRVGFSTGCSSFYGKNVVITRFFCRSGQAYDGPTAKYLRSRFKILALDVEHLQRGE